MKSITEVCRLLDMTSRTVRYYEQCGLIRTTRSSPAAPRRLDGENMERLRKIRFLRKLGLSIDEIKSVIDSDKAAAEFITGKIADMKAEINFMIERINLLREVVTVAEKGEDIYSVEKQLDQLPDESEMLRIAAEVTKLVVERRFDEIKPYLNSDMSAMPAGFFEVGWDVHIKPCGKFLSIGKQSIIADTVINRLHFEKQDAAICIEVHAGLVTGMLLQYVK